MAEHGTGTRAARATTLALPLLGTAAVLATILLPLGSHPSFPPKILWAVLTTVILIWVPFTLPRSQGDVIMSFAPGPLVFLLLLLDHRTAVAWWLVGVTLGRISYRGRRRWRSRVFNIATAAVSAVPAVAVVSVLREAAAPGVPSVVGLVTTVVGLLAFYVCYFAVSTWWVSTERRVRWSEAEASPFTGMSLLLLLGTGSVAYVATLIVSVLPAWTIALLLAPVLVVVVIGRRLVGDDRRQRRSARLYDSAARFAALVDAGQVDGVLVGSARAVVDDDGARLDDHEPGPGRWAAVYVVNGRSRWLSVPTPRHGRNSEADLPALNQLCSLARRAHERITDADNLRHSARTDPLTGLVNRTVLLARLAAAVLDGASGTGRGLILIDLDDFKEVNDSYGHAVGDEFLTEVAHRLVDAAGTDDVVARLGGDEFAVLVLDAGGGRAPSCARRISRALSGELRIGGTAVGVGASIGVAGWTSRDTPTIVLSNADIALYAAKKDGKGTVRIFDQQMVDTTTRKVRMAADLARDVDTLSVHYQPVVDLRTGRVDGCEALVRWQRDGRPVSPSVFVALAEETGLIEALGRRVLRQVVDDLPVINAAAGRALSVAVNISASQLADPQLLELVRAGVRASDGAAFILEMTERVLIDDSEATMAAVHELTATGARLTLDDFGSGYSAIGYLRRLPISGVKFDRSVIAGVDESAQRRDLLRGLVALCAAMDITPLAEGVETRAEWATVLELDCVLGQGYAFARPQPLPGLVELLHRHVEDLAVPTHLAVPVPR